MREQRGGLLAALAAYTMWGLLPLYWPLLKPASPLEILAHRMVWSLVVMVLVLLMLRRGGGWVAELLRRPQRMRLVVLAAVVISVNWGTYIWAVNSEQVVEAAFGYFITPLLTIALGLLALRERLRPVQWAAVSVGAAAVLVLEVGYGHTPWTAMMLAATFATYGLLKKKIGLPGLESVTAESAVQFLPAVAFLAFLAVRGGGTFGRTVPGGHGGVWGHALLLSGAGLATAVPMLCFSAAAVRVPLTTLGLVQYLAPVFQLLVGLAVFHEPMPASRWIGFGLVWAALLLLVGDELRRARRSGRSPADATAPGAPGAHPDLVEEGDAQGGSTGAVR